MLKKNSFDQNNYFKLSKQLRSDAQKIFQILQNEIELLKKIPDDPTILDSLTYELLRLCKSREYHYIDDSHKFTKGFNTEIMKHQNRQVLCTFLNHWFGIQKIDAHLIFNLAFQAQLSEGKPIFRKEVYGHFINDPMKSSGFVPFWVEPREKFMEYLFLFRFSLICAQSSLKLSREASMVLIESLRITNLKNLNAMKKENTRSVEIPIENWLNLGLPILKSTKKSDPIREANKVMASKLSLSWAVAFTHLDYMRSLSWRRIKNEPNCFLAQFVANALGPVALMAHSVNSTRSQNLTSQREMSEIFSKLSKQIKNQKAGKLFTLKNYSDEALIKMYERYGCFGYSNILSPSLTATKLESNNRFGPLDLEVMNN